MALQLEGVSFHFSLFTVATLLIHWWNKDQRKTYSRYQKPLPYLCVGFLSVGLSYKSPYFNFVGIYYCIWYCYNWNRENLILLQILLYYNASNLYLSEDTSVCRFVTQDERIPDARVLVDSSWRRDRRVRYVS